MNFTKWIFKKKKPITKPPYLYKRVNFLDGFRKMDFELEDEPDLLVEKILSVDPEWIGNADIEFYGRDGYSHGSFYQSNSTKVPCLEGEWVVVCYSKAKRTFKDNEIWKSSDWHKYYLCQIDFSHEYLFRVIKDFEHIYDAFKYLYKNQLVSIIKSDQRVQKQISLYYADILLDVLTDFEKDESEYTYEELAPIFLKYSKKNKELRAYIEDVETRLHPTKEEKELKNQEEFMCGLISGRFLSTKPYDCCDKLTIQQYLKLVREYKNNYLWNL